MALLGQLLNSLNTARKELAGCGTQSLSLAFGGVLVPGAVTGATELWNGTSWTTSPGTMATARRGLGGIGSQTAALGFAGYGPGYSTATEEWTGPYSTLNYKTLTTS
jgi:hypothetical protein